MGYPLFSQLVRNDMGIDGNVKSEREGRTHHIQNLNFQGGH